VIASVPPHAGGLLVLLAKWELQDHLTWEVEDGSLHFYFNCNDLFANSCSDAEEVEPTDMIDLAIALEDAADAKAIAYGPHLWACRKRRCKPNRVYVIKALDDLFQSISR
jgi:hypothetical protein